MPLLLIKLRIFVLWNGIVRIAFTARVFHDNACLCVFLSREIFELRNARVWIAGSAGKQLAYFMYPQAETSEGRVDPFDPDNFKYEITVKEIS